MSDEIFREVDEEVKQERLLSLWKQYGWFVTSLLVLVLAATSGIALWQNQREARRAELSMNFAVATQLANGGDVDAAVSAFDEVAEGDGGYAMLARFRQAALFAERGDREAALQIYQAIAGQNDYDPLYRDLAQLLGASVILDGPPDGFDLADARQRVDSLITDDNPLRYTAREMSAALALADGDLGMARERFKQLSDDDGTPLSIRQRAARLLKAVGES